MIGSMILNEVKVVRRIDILIPFVQVWEPCQSLWYAPSTQFYQHYYRKKLCRSDHSAWYCFPHYNWMLSHQHGFRSQWYQMMKLFSSRKVSLYYNHSAGYQKNQGWNQDQQPYYNSEHWLEDLNYGDVKIWCCYTPKSKATKEGCPQLHTNPVSFWLLLSCRIQIYTFLFYYF